MTTLTIEQLNAALPGEVITAARTKSLTSPRDDEAADPVAEQIAAACALVDASAAGWLVPAEILTAVARDIAAWHIAARVGKTSEAQDKAFDRAHETLDNLREGRLPGIQPDPESSAPAGRVFGGSRAKIL